MKEKKKSFILYDDDIECVRHLTTKQAGLLLQSIVKLRINGEVPDFGDDAALKILFHQITSHIAMNEEKYKAMCEQRANAAKSRWEAKEKMRTDANASTFMRDDAKRCYNENDNENDNNNVYDNKNENVNENANGNGNENERPYPSAAQVTEKPNYDLSSVESFFLSAEKNAKKGRYPGSS